MPLPLFQWTFPSMLRSGGTKYTFCSLLGSDVRSTNFYSSILWTKGCWVWTLCIFYSSVYELSNLWMLVHIHPLRGFITWVEVRSPYGLGKFLDTKCTRPYMAWKVSRHPLGCIRRLKDLNKLRHRLGCIHPLKDLNKLRHPLGCICSLKD